MRLSNDQVALLLDNISEAIIAIDKEHRIVYFNQVAEQVFGFRAQETIGQPIDLLLPERLVEIHRRHISEFIAASRTAVTITNRTDLVARRKDGTEFPVEIGISKIDQDGQEFYTAIVVDITKRKQAERALGESEAKLKQAQQLSHIGHSERDLIADRIIWSEETCKIFGLTSPGYVLSQAELQEMIHPDDRQLQREALRAAIQRSQLYDVEYRIVRPDGEVRFVHTRDQIVYDDAGQPVRMFGTVQDITERKRLEEELRRRAANQAALNEVIAAVTEASTDLQATMETALDLTLKAFGLRMGAIWLNAAPEFSDRYILRGLTTEIASVVAQATTEGIANIVEPWVVTDWSATTSQVGQIVHVYGINASIIVPLMTGGEEIGGLGIASPQSRQWSEEEVGMAKTLGHQLGMAVERARLFQATRQYAQQLELLYDAGLSLNQAHDVSVLLKTLLPIMAQVVQADRIDYYRFDPQRQVLKLESAAGYDDDAELNSLRAIDFALGEERGLTGWVAKKRTPLYLADAQGDSRWIPFDPTIRSILWVPVERQNELRGVLAVKSTRLNAFAGANQHIVILLANQLAGAMENARLYDETQSRIAELETVSRLSGSLRAAQTLDEILNGLLKETLAVLDAAAGTIWLYDPAKDELRQEAELGFPNLALPLKPTAGIAGHVFATGEPYISAEFKSDPLTDKSARARIPRGLGGACVPIRAAQQVIGVIFVSVQKPRQLTPREMRLLNTIAEIAGSAIHRTRLFEQSEQQVRRLAALHTIDKAITSGVDTRLVFDVILDQVVNQLQVDAVDVLLFNSSTQTLEYAAGRGFRGSWNTVAKVKLGEPHAGRVALERQTLLIPSDITSGCSRAFTALLRAEGFVSYYGIPMISKGELKGVFEIYHRRPFLVKPTWDDFARILAEQTAIAADNGALFANLQRSKSDLTLAYDSTLEGWSRTLDLRDKETEGHTQRVTQLTVQLARAMGIAEDELIHIHRGALLHDIGKMGVPDRILLKEGELTEEEWEQMRKHPVYAYELLSPIAFLHDALDIPYCHHEKWDGTGYPRGLKDDQIPLAARIFAVVDVWDALRSDRPYRPAWLPNQVREHIKSLAGSHFDPQIVPVFLQTVSDS